LEWSNSRLITTTATTGHQGGTRSNNILLINANATRTVHSPSYIGKLSRFWLAFLGPIVYWLQSLLNYLAFQSLTISCRGGSRILS
jgi:hypothetical protein